MCADQSNPIVIEPSTTSASGRVRVWDLPTRVFHWLLAAAFVGAYLTGEAESYRALHITFGYTLAGLIGFRVVWGLVGTRYARFHSFLFGPGETLAYLKSLLTSSPKHYFGHNPAGAIVIFLMLILGVATATSGYLHYRELGGRWLEELHEGAANFMLLLVVVHLVGVVVSSFLHRENLAAAMVTGTKRGEVAAGITQSKAAIAGVVLVAVLGYWALDPAIWTPDTGSVAEHRKDKSRHHDDDD